MPLSPDTRLGTYLVVSPLGAGGMGEVYRATDTKLGRDVALKLLPGAFAADPDRLARFEREAKVLASLNHPGIAHLYGFEGATLSDGTTAHFLAMELAPGEDLSERLKRGPIPLGEALEIAKQIAEALEEAHEKGIVHRDLKPANVKLTPDGKVKLLAFGLARAWSGEDQGSVPGTSALSESPTLAHTGTAAGLILGTAAYMSPEQARGKAVDKRADIWSFGVVLYEMLTGRTLFAGETVSDVLAGVLKSEVDFGALPDATPAGVRRLLRGCLKRNPRNRLHDIADVRLVIDEGGSADLREPARPIASQQAHRWLPWVIAAASLAVAVLALVLGRTWLGASAGAAETLRLQLVPPKGERLALSNEYGRTFAISPDGSKIVYAVEAGPTSELRLRSLDSVLSTPIPGTNGGMSPFFSPDGSVLSWVDREGRGEPLKLPAASYSRVSLSPAGDRVVLSIGNQVSVLDLARLSTSQLTLAGRAEYAIWARDGRRVLFGYEQGKRYQIYSKAADDAGKPELVVSSDATEDPLAVSTDGSRMLGLRSSANGQSALLVHDLRRPQGEPAVIFQSSNMYSGYSDFSPDGRFVVYQTEESGRPEIYVRPASGEDRKWQVSIGGGTAPVWSAAGDEIFFLSRPQLLAAPVHTSGDEPKVGEPRVLFENRRVIAFDAARDARRFLIAEDPNPGAQPRLDVVVQWSAEVQRKVAAARTP